MDSSRRAVEAYWRSRMIDGATSDEDKVTPVYKLEEICELLRSSHVSIVKEVSEYIFKRLDHKSPVVKQKALRLIKYAVGKSGVEFRREMQRHSAAIRHLFHYKGQVDPLKGDALNKAVRDTAHEAISAIFASEESKVSPAEDLNRRIEGFGNTNFEMPSDDRKSFLSEVVGIGSASIKQGLSSLTAAHSIRKNDTGTYKSPTLRRSLTTDMNSSDRYERGGEYNGETRMSSGYSSASSGTWGQDSNVNISEMNNRDSSSSRGGSKSREERLLETIVTPGGVRLQPTRDALHVFLLEASKLDAVALSRALETKLQSHLWQVRMKAVCVLESILRKKDDEHFEVIASYFSENKDSVVKCSESPQASLREKSMKVLCLIDGGSVAGTTNLPENPSIVKTEAPVVVQMPDLIDTGDSDDYFGQEESNKKQSEASGGNLITTETLVTNDLFGDSLISDISTNENKNEDPFAGVSFHTAENSEHVDLFSGLDVDDKKQGNLPANKHGPELVDLFGTSMELMQEQTGHGGHLQDLMAGMSINENNSDSKQQRVFSGTLPEATLGLGTQPSHQASKDALNGAFSSQMSGMNPNLMFPLGSMQYNVPSNIMLNQAFASNPMNYGAMGNFLAQQQLLAAMSNIQSIGNLGTQPDANLGNVVGNSMDGGYASPLPDIFHPNMPVQTHTTMMASSKKEETKAFDFISDHLSAARGSKRVI